MLKRHCDVCKKEIAGPSRCHRRVSRTAQIEGVSVNVEIVAGTGYGNYTTGDICLDCLKKAVMKSFALEENEVKNKYNFKAFSKSFPL